MKFRLAASAVSDVDDILKHLRSESPSGAESVADRFDEVFRSIEDFPNLGRVTSRKGMRWKNTHPYPYLVFYKTSPSLTEVVAVRHGARNPKSMPAGPR
jgi:toxin ParE1/3/4